MKKSFLPVLLLAKTIFTLAACSPSPAQTPVETPVAPVENLIAEGRLQPANALDQSFSIPGQVAEVLVKDGDMVKTGQALARLVEDPNAQTALARARQEMLAAQQALDNLKSAAALNLAQGKLAVLTAQDALDKAQTRYDADETAENQALLDEAAAQLKQAEDAQRKLQSGAGVDPDQLAAAQARLASAEASLKGAQAMMDAYELKSTLDGTITNIAVQTGQKINAGQPVFTVADFSQWLVKTDNLTEMDVVKLQVGQKVSVVFDALPGQSLAGEVTHINLFSGEKRGDTTYTVTVALGQSVPEMRWGMTAAVQFVP